MQILSLLKTEARNPRELARSLGKHETHISSRLRFMERMGLVKGRWIRKDGKNVKLYELRTDSIQLSLTPEGYEAKFSSSSGPVTVPLFAEVGIPSCPNFVGRMKERESLKSAGNFIAVEGIAGIGKTWLVARFVGQVPFKEIFWHSIKGFDTFDSVVRKLAIFLRAKGKTELYDYVKSSGPDDSVKLELLTKEVDNGRNILVFDDYHMCSDKNIEDLVEHLKNNLHKTRVVIISRTRPRFASGEGVVEVVVPGFTLKETAAFLITRGIGSKVALLNLVQEKLHGHPLSLEFLAEVSKGGDIDPALKLVKESKLVRYLWTQVYESLSQPERGLLQTMSVFRTPVEMGVLRFACGSKVAPFVYELERKNLVVDTGQRYSLHDLVKEMAYGLLDSPREIHRKVADYYLEEGSWNSLIEGVYHLLQAKEYEKIAKVVKQQYDVGDPILYSEYAIPYMALLKTIPLDSVSKELQAYLLAVIARIESQHGDLKSAVEIYSDALESADKQRDLALVAKIDVGLGRAYYAMGRMGKAENYLLRGAEHLERVGDYFNLSQTYYSLSALYKTTGLMDKALAYAQQCLRTAKIAPSRTQSLHCLYIAHDNLGVLYGKYMGRFTKGKEHSRMALKILGRLSEPNASVIAQLNLIHIYEEEGKFEDALALCEKSIEVWKGKSFSEKAELLAYAKALRARLLLLSGRETDTKELDDSVRMFRRVKHAKSQALGDVETTLGMIHSKCKRWSEAVKHYRRAFNIVQQDVFRLGKVFEGLATMWLEKGDYRRFQSQARKAIELFRIVRADHRASRLEKLLPRAGSDIAVTPNTLATTEAENVR